jgi:aliphatic nitrilase
MAHPKFIAAAVQAEPAFLDLSGSVAKTLRLIDESAAHGASLIAFPEAWIPGYPWWIWLDSPAWGMQFVQRYHDNSIVAASAEMAAICAGARRNRIHVVLGTSEKDHGSLYLGQSIIGPDGSVIAHRRKLKPTHVERTVFGEGHGKDLAVHETALGRLGALCCWEHLQPLTKYAMYSMFEQVHVASWPSFSLYTGKAFALGPQLNNAASQVYAAEGGCFVIAPCATVSQKMQDLLCDTPAKRDLLRVGGGFAMIFGPDGRPITDPIAETEEGIVYAEVDLGLISLAKAAADPVGHYSRPDVTRLLLNRSSGNPVESFVPDLSATALTADDEAGEPLPAASPQRDGSPR